MLWSAALYDLLVQKQGNLQMGVELEVPHYADIVQSRAVLDVFVDGALAMKEFLDTFR